MITIKAKSVKFGHVNELFLTNRPQRKSENGKGKGKTLLVKTEDAIVYVL
jgi:hypothetical protein